MIRAFAALLACMLVFTHAAPAQPPKFEPELLQESAQVHPGGTIRVALKVELPKGYHVNSEKPLEDFLIPTQIAVSPPTGLRLQELVFPEPIMLDQAGSKLAVFEEKFVIGIALVADDTLPPGELTRVVTMRYQSCDDKACYAPAKKENTITVTVVPADTPIEKQNAELFTNIPFSGETNVDEPDVSSATTTPAEPRETENKLELFALLDEFEILGTTGYANAKDFIQFIDDAEAGRVRKGWFEGKGPLAIAVFILLGGLGLNLTPCVLPMIPINLAIIGAGSKAGSRARGFALGGAYGLAMALVYGILGLVVILTAGTFGTINSSPWFNLGIAILFVVLGLAMFDVISIDFSRFQAKFNLAGKNKGSFFVAFGMGCVAALLAGACVAPIVIQVIVFAVDQYAKGHTVALALPFLLGLGMALPWPVAGAGLSFLPKPGMWMVRVKQAFGVFILAFAAYYGYLTYEIFQQRNVDSAEVAESVDAMLKEGWYASMTPGLMAAKEENKLVLVDLWATWCKNCLVMDRTTLKDPAVTARLENYVKIKFQAEDPSSSPAKDVMRHFDAKGLPTYAILRHKH